MSVAKSYENFTKLSEPYEENGKMYIQLQNPKTGTIRKARWYEEAKVKKTNSGNPNLKRVRGFSKGPILVVRNIKTHADELWCKESNARYAVGIGWHFVSEEELPAEMPKSLKYVLLTWDEFKGKDDFHSKTSKQLAAIITRKLEANKTITFC